MQWHIGINLTVVSGRELTHQHWLTIPKHDNVCHFLPTAIIMWLLSSQTEPSCPVSNFPKWNLYVLLLSADAIFPDKSRVQFKNLMFFMSEIMVYNELHKTPKSVHVILKITFFPLFGKIVYLYSTNAPNDGFCLMLWNLRCAAYTSNSS